MKEYHIKPGEKHNRLTAIKLDHIGNHNRSYFLFKCDCGKEKVILGSGVKSGNTKSCGCLSYEVKKSKLLPNGQAAFIQTYNSYKCHAKQRKLGFNLTKDEFKILSQQKCYYCGADLSNTCKTDSGSLFNHNGIDRRDNNKGYDINNCVACCKDCNKAKMDKTEKEFLQWVKKISNYQNAMAEQWG